MNLVDLQKALSEVEAVIWATCEWGSIGREKMNVLMNLCAGKVLINRKQLTDLVKQSLDLHQELDASDIANYILIMSGVLANDLNKLVSGSEGSSPPLSKQEIEDLEVAEKEIASGKCKTFKTADELIAELQKGRKKGSVKRETFE